MTTSHSPIIVVGAGLAGWAVVDALRAKTDTNITLITADNADRYHKPMLSSGFGQAKTPDSLVRMTGETSAQTANITLISHSTVTHIHSDKKTLIYQKNNKNHEVSYDNLVLATGAMPIYPQGIDGALATDLNHLDGYRTIFDKLMHAKQAGKPCHIAIIGAGMVGVELAEDLTLGGAKVSLIDVHAYPLSSLLPPVAGERFLIALTNLGVNYISYTRPISTTTTDDTITLTLDNGKIIECDGVIVATGLGFDNRLAVSAGLDHGRYGFEVDEFLQTNIQGIFALGDAVMIDGVPCRFVAPHRSQASTIASVITGTPTPYKHTTPMIRLKNKCLSIQATGQAFAKTDWQIVSDSDGKLIMNKVVGGQEIATLTVVQKS